MHRTPAPRASLAKRREALLAEKAALLAKLAEITTQQRTRDRQERLALQAQVGKLADDAGLLAYDLGTLGKLFAAVVRMSVKDPKAVQEFLGLDAILHGEVDVIQVVDEDGRPLVPSPGAERNGHDRR